MKSREDWVNKYYEKYFNSLCNSGIQGKGSAIIHKSVEKYWNSLRPEKILEVGAGDGSHFAFTHISNPQDSKLFALDIRPPRAPIGEVVVNTKNLKIEWVKGSVEEIPFPENTFDRVTSTCLMHHVDDPYNAMLEMRRVVKVSGEISIGMPTDPGLLNRAIKKLYTYRKAKKLGLHNPAFIYSLDHQNHIFGLIEIAKEVFSQDDLRIHYLPFGINSPNLNVLTVVHVIKK